MEEKIAAYSKQYIMSHPKWMPWNIVPRVFQFTQHEILKLSDYLDIRDIVRFQEEATYDFIREYFSNEVDVSDRVDWVDIRRYTAGRKISVHKVDEV